MKFTLKVNLGNSELVIEQECDGIKGLFKEAGIFSTFPSECNSCKSGNLALNERQTAKGEYYEITCQDCGYRKEYGQSKDKVTLFPKDWEAPYEADGEESSSSNSGSGSGALAKAKKAKAAAKAAKEAEAEASEEYEDVPDEDAPPAKTATSNKRSALLAKFKKKGA